MAYQTGTYTDVHDALTKLHDFAVLYGWTADRFTAGSGQTTPGESFFHKGTDEYYSFQSEIEVDDQYFMSVNETGIIYPHISCCGNTGYSAINDYLNQPGSTNSATGRVYRTHWITDIGPRKYWLFTDGNPGDYVHMVLNNYPREYSHILIGNLDKTGAGVYTGGRYICPMFWNHSSSRTPLSSAHSPPFNRYFSGSNWGCAVHAEIDSLYWHLIFSSDASPYGRGSVRDDYYVPMQYRFMPRGVNTRMHNIIMRVNRIAGNVNILGTVRDTRSVAMHLLQPEQEVTLEDASTWIIFPMSSNNPSNTPGNTNSFPYGYAYRTDV